MPFIRCNPFSEPRRRISLKASVLSSFNPYSNSYSKLLPEKKKKLYLAWKTTHDIVVILTQATTGRKAAQPNALLSLRASALNTRASDGYKRSRERPGPGRHWIPSFEPSHFSETAPSAPGCLAKRRLSKRRTSKARLVDCRVAPF